jgi:hypothetical protein
MTTQTPSGLYEQLKDDLGYLKLVHAAELLPALLDRAREEQLHPPGPGIRQGPPRQAAGWWCSWLRS